MSTQLILNQLSQINHRLNRIDQKLNEHDEKFDLIFRKLDAHDKKFETAFEVLGIIQEQTKKIPQMEKDIHNLKNDMSVVKKVLIDRNKQITRHKQFINRIKTAAAAV